MSVRKQQFICRVLLALALVHVGAIGGGAIAIVGCLTSWFGLVPYFVICCLVILGGLLLLISAPDKILEEK